MTTKLMASVAFAGGLGSRKLRICEVKTPNRVPDPKMIAS